MNGYWNGSYSGWGWVLWFGVFFVLFSGIGNWGYTYRAHRRFDSEPARKNAIDFLNERYAKGELTRDEFYQIKAEIAGREQGSLGALASKSS